MLAVAAGWLWIVRRSRATGRGPYRSTRAMMGCATVRTGPALIWPHVAPLAIGPVRGAR